jgi:hypothetical protein
MTRVVAGDPNGCPDFLRWLAARVTSRPEALRVFLRAALLERPNGPRLLVKSDVQPAELFALWDVLAYVLGGYAVRLRRDSWWEWPERLDAVEALTLSQARLVCLPALERWERFPQMAADAMLTNAADGFFSWRDQLLPFSARFFYGAPVRKIERLEETLGKKLFFLPVPQREALAKAAPEPSDFLAEEASHILAWFAMPTREELESRLAGRPSTDEGASNG